MNSIDPLKPIVETIQGSNGQIYTVSFSSEKTRQIFIQHLQKAVLNNPDYLARELSSSPKDEKEFRKPRLPFLNKPISELLPLQSPTFIPKVQFPDSENFNSSDFFQLWNES